MKMWNIKDAVSVGGENIFLNQKLLFFSCLQELSVESRGKSQYQHNAAQKPLPTMILLALNLLPFWTINNTNIVKNILWHEQSII